ncbi:MAG: Eco57I restriction-modification methylase domain-containing protein [Lewinellaceae bacterium]|nr:Eco57I restriction-modification methylase domain-containing protein [Lewinellaceae bacterium]
MRGNYLGFDAVLGNPPYIRQEELGPFKNPFPKHLRNLRRHRRPVRVFRGARHEILRPGGQFSYILPNKWMRAGYGDKLRRYVKRLRHIEGISDFGDLPVFEEATTYPCILELRRADAQPTFPAAAVGTLSYEGR